jgi:ATP-binding cassette, subfamily F, member 3
LIFISHDVYFIRALASSVLHINSGKLTPYAGDYQYYLDKSKATSEKQALTAGAAPTKDETASNSEIVSKSKKSKEQKRFEAEERQRRSNERKQHQEKVSKLEAEILHLETQQKELTAKLEDPATYSTGNVSELNRQLAAVTDSLEAVTKEWEALAANVAERDSSLRSE